MKRVSKRLNVLEKLCDDCWTEVSSFFYHPKTVFSLIECSKDFKKMFQIRGRHFCVNVRFTFYSKLWKSMKTFELFKKDSEDQVQYVFRLRLRLDKFYRFKPIGRHNEVMKAIFMKFPNLRVLSLESYTSKRMKKVFFISPSSLKEGKNLQEISIKGHVFRNPKGVDGLFSQLSELKKLRKLSFKSIDSSNFRVTTNRNVDIPGINLIPRLLSLSIENVNSADFFTSTSTSKTIKELIIKRSFKTSYPSNLLNSNIFRFPSLKRIVFEEISPCGRIIPLVRNNSQHLESIQITCHTHNENHGKDTEFYDEKIFGKGCPVATYLNLTSCNSFDGSFLSYFQPRILRHLYLGNCNQINVDLLVSQEEMLNYLQTVSFENCQQITDEVLEKLISVKNLSLEGIDSTFITSDGFSNMKNLEALNLFRCECEELDLEFLKKVFAANEKLEKIFVLKCDSGIGVSKEEREVIEYINRSEITKNVENVERIFMEDSQVYKWVKKDRLELYEYCQILLNCKDCGVFVEPRKCYFCDKLKCELCTEFGHCENESCSSAKFCEDCTSSSCFICEKSYCKDCATECLTECENRCGSFCTPNNEEEEEDEEEDDYYGGYHSGPKGDNCGAYVEVSSMYGYYACGNCC